MTADHPTHARILIVDDQEANLRLLERILFRAGYTQVRRTSDPRETLSLCESFGPDLLLLDLLMPHMDGCAVMRQVKDRLPDGAYLPIVVLTADITPEAKQRALSMGATDFPTKPFDVMEVLLRIRNLLETRFLHLQLQRQNRTLEESVRERTAALEQTLEELRRTQEQVIQQERLRALGEMSSGIAHDFNNSLTPILGFTELLLRSQALKDAERATRYLEMIRTAAKDAAHIVARLKEFYRPRDAKEPFEVVELNALVRQAVSLTQPKWKDQALSRGATIRIHLDLSDVPPIRGLEAELREALANLIFNAADAVSEGGEITLRTREVGNSVALEIVDTGVVMPEEVLRRCLDPFFTTKGERGSGLGLAMVHGIVHRHDGQLEIDSRAGEGTTIRITFPVPKSRAAEAITEADRIISRSLTILLVEDDPMIREVLNEYLTEEGHAVVVASDGEEGLERFSLQPFDLVLTDKAMPRMSGDQMAANIKRRSPCQPVLMMSGFGEMMHASGEARNGVDYILSKPVSLDQLNQAMSKVMSGVKP